MTFTQSCFVRVENPEERKELIGWCEEIGYKFLMRGLESNIFYTDKTSGCLLCAFESHITQAGMVSRGYIDCGSNIELFKALAAMNNENDQEQWFVFAGKYNDVWKKCKKEVFSLPKSCWHKADAAEIIEHFKNCKK